METYRAKLYYTDPNTKEDKWIIAEGKDVGNAAQNAVHLFQKNTDLPITCITRIDEVIE